MKKIAILGSGSGSNAENICRFFCSSKQARVVLFGTNNKNSFFVKRAEKLNLPCIIFSKKELLDFSVLESLFVKKGVDCIVLAGFLLKIPEKMIAKYPKKILNLHPSLLPKYGGVGMYGLNVHESVLKNKEIESGITIHLVNKDYDKGEVLFQKKCLISKNESVSSLSQKIKLLEHKYFPAIIKKHLL